MPGQLCSITHDPEDCQVSTSTAALALGWNRVVSVMLSLFKPCLALNFQFRKCAVSLGTKALALLGT